MPSLSSSNPSAFWLLGLGQEDPSRVYPAWAGLLTISQGALSCCWEMGRPRVSTARSSRIWWLMALQRVGRKGKHCKTPGSFPLPVPIAPVLSGLPSGNPRSQPELHQRHGCWGLLPTPRALSCQAKGLGCRPRQQEF